MAIALPCICSAVPTPDVVTTYYSSIRGLSTDNTNSAFEYENAIKACFFGYSNNDGSGFSGINIKDYLFENDSVASNAWAQRLKRKIHIERALKFETFSVQRTDLLIQPTLKRSNDDEITVSTVNYSYKLDSRQYNRQEYIGVVMNRIIRISDSFFGADAVSLTIEAAKLYTEKKYKEAYDTYQRILTTDPDNPNILFRVGIMTALGRGTKRNDMVARSYLMRIDDALHKASRDKKPVDWNMSKKAEDAIYYIDHPQHI